jgi:hypothetical protein
LDDLSYSGNIWFGCQIPSPSIKQCLGHRVGFFAVRGTVIGIGVCFEVRFIRSNFERFGRLVNFSVFTQVIVLILRG